MKMQSLKDFRVTIDLDRLGPRDVIGHATIGFGVSTFLLVVNDDHVSILHCYEDIKPQSCVQQWRIQNFPLGGGRRRRRRDVGSRRRRRRGVGAWGGGVPLPRRGGV